MHNLSIQSLSHLKKALPMAAAVLLTVAASSCHKQKDSTDGSATPSVDVAEAFTDSVTLYKTYPGTLQAATVADVVARVNGELLTANFKPGDYVTKGQLLFTIEPTIYKNAVEKAQSALTTAKTQYEFYLKQSEAMKKAFAAEAVSKMEVMQSETNLEQARQSMASATATLSTARQNLGYCRVTAPVSGYISAVAVDPGNYVSGEASAVVLATIYDNSALNAVFSLSDSQYEELLCLNGGLGGELFRNVPLKFRERLPQEYSVNLYYQSPTVDTETGTVTMKGRLNNADKRLKNGMYVTVSLPYSTMPEAILVKDASIGSDQLGSYLYTVNEKNEVVHTPVTVGDVYQDSLRVVTSGIKPGTRYVTKALLTVKAGEKINPVLTK